ncbi:hypothetical protein GCM10011585_05630 [Edaphobacter dinghuensis]|uniref:Uncharacterized protein n=1 Tax=Edaphobacter dinghuensis TaxID=1560005 RepID=A0A917H3S2_9BACT|nr:hypothetical protein GCM10011585_05630 [Edaphobacter dinghuensis]
MACSGDGVADREQEREGLPRLHPRKDAFGNADGGDGADGLLLFCCAGSNDEGIFGARWVLDMRWRVGRFGMLLLGWSE